MCSQLSCIARLIAKQSNNIDFDFDAVFVCWGCRLHFAACAMLIAVYQYRVAGIVFSARRAYHSFTFLVILLSLQPFERPLSCACTTRSSACDYRSIDIRFGLSVEPNEFRIIRIYNIYMVRRKPAQRHFSPVVLSDLIVFSFSVLLI